MSKDIKTNHSAIGGILWYGAPKVIFLIPKGDLTTT
jgi:hypothetical protein